MVMQGKLPLNGTTGNARCRMDIDEVKYIITASGSNLAPGGAKIFWGIKCKHCSLLFESGHKAYTLECMKGSTHFSPHDGYVNPYAQTYAISLAGAGYTPPGDRKVKFVGGYPTISTEKKVYRGRCPCGCEVKCDYHEIIP